MASSLHVVLLCTRSADLGQRCGAGFHSTGRRCCPKPQTASYDRCTGELRACPSGFHLSTTAPHGCVLDSQRVAIPPRTYRLGPEDWSSSDIGFQARRVEGFWIDRGEVTVEGWNVCAEVGRCPTLPLVASVGKSPEPGQPVANVSVEQAESYCRWAGGRLPHADEWLAAALGEKGSRFPWGQTGLVCRRAVYGVVRGPCAQGSTQPEIGGTRPDGATPEGLVDVVGNVGELVLGANGPEIRGGSFQSELASQLRTWSVLPYGGPQPDVGFRCVYDQPTPDGGEARANR